MRIDLHVHTTASDGALPPAEVVRLAVAEGLDTVAVTDHDTVSGVAEASAAARAAGLEVVAGIELSAAEGGRHVHVLGLFVDPGSPGLRRALQRFRRSRLERARRIVERLGELGYPLRLEDVLAEARGTVVARPHVARALVRAGLLPDVEAAFTPELLGDGGPADLPRDDLTPPEAVRLVREAGGVAVLAHPGTLEAREPGLAAALAARLAGCGLDGLEVDHPLHPPQVRDRLRGLALGLGLVPTGGSDFHGPGMAYGGRLGACTTSPEALAELRARRPGG